ncbi:MAG: TIGR04211 family SH3 domain-containing protein [Gammaproteobacteria bacterium]
MRQIVFFSLLLQPLWLAAEQVYINDTLRVGVRPSPSGNVAPIAVVTTGMRLQVVDRADGYLKIQGDDGIEGWIKEIFTIDEPPSVIKLQTLQKQHAAMQQEVKRLKTELQVAAKATQVLTEKLESQKADTSKLQLELAHKVGQERLEETQHSIFWWLSLFIIPTLAFAAFYGGIVWYRNQAQKRLGGLRV